MKYLVDSWDLYRMCFEYLHHVGYEKPLKEETI